MQDLDIGFMSFLLLGAVAAFVAIYYSFGMVREWLGQWTRATNGAIRKTVAHDASLDGHIATQWTEGRLRLDFLLAMIKQLEV